MIVLILLKIKEFIRYEFATWLHDRFVQLFARETIVCVQLYTKYIVCSIMCEETDSFLSRAAYEEAD
jgi:hypothetical protein